MVLADSTTEKTTIEIRLGFTIKKTQIQYDLKLEMGPEYTFDLQ